MSAINSVVRADASRGFVSRTARAVAVLRAMETEKGEAGLINDPFARALGGPSDVMGDWISSLPPHALDFMVAMAGVRTKYIDDWLTEAVAAADAPKQLVILGSGLDARAYRLPALAALHTYEVDFEEVHAYKSGLVEAAPLGPHTYVIADLSLPEWTGALLAAGFDAALPSLWLLEGLTGYLKEAEVTSLFRTLLGLSAPGSRLLATVLGNECEIAGPGTGKSKMHSFFCDEPSAFIKACGWPTAVHVSLGTPAAEYGRPVISPDYAYYFLSATR